MAHQMQATPDQVLTVLGVTAGTAVALVAGFAAWRWWTRPTATRRRQVARDVRALERSTR